VASNSTNEECKIRRKYCQYLIKRSLMMCKGSSRSAASRFVSIKYHMDTDWQLLSFEITTGYWSG
jgi:hypothetical protein